MEKTAGGFFSPRTPEPGTLVRNLNQRNSPQGRLLVSVDLTAGKTSATGGCLRFVPGPAARELPAFSLCACAQAGRQSRPARERHVFVFFVSAVHCLENKSYTIRKRRGPGRNLLPGRVWGSAPAFPLPLRNTTGNCSRAPSATGDGRASPGVLPGPTPPFRDTALPHPLPRPVPPGPDARSSA